METKYSPEHLIRPTRAANRDPHSDGAPGLPLFLKRTTDDVAPSSRSARALQRAPAEGSTAPAPTETAAPAAIPARTLLVEDSITDPAPEQMRKGEFLATLRVAVCATAEDALRGTLWSAVGCPWIGRWFDHYAGQSAAHVESALRRYAPAASGAKSARDYVPLVCARVRSAIRGWSETGETPEGLPAGEAPGEPPSGSGPLSMLTGMLFKRESGAAGSPAGARSGLGAGRPLDGGSRARMEAAFGHDFSRVRVHADPGTARLAQGLQARAFTIGEHVGFGPGEFQPGTPIGDALIAHELAHVVQQSGASAPASPRAALPEAPSLEEEADRSALGVMLRLWGASVAALGAVVGDIRPGLREGIQLRSCKSERQKEIERLGGLQYDFLERKRKEKEEEERKKAEQAAKDAGLPPPTTAPTVTVEDTIKEETKKSGFATHPATPWTSLSAADQASWKSRAKAAWDSVVASVKGTELENVIKGKSYDFQPEEALTKGYYAWQNGTKLAFGMAWVRNAEADPKNAWPNIAHELGGHFEYGPTYASEIMKSAIERMPKAEREKWEKDAEFRRMFYLTYEYPETEIFAAVRERRYSNPEVGPAPTYGGLQPDINIPTRLKQMKDTLDPEVAKGVLKELRRRIEANPEILERDKQFFIAQAKAVFGYEP